MTSRGGGGEEVNGGTLRRARASVQSRRPRFVTTSGRPHGLIDARTAPLTTPSLRRRVSILRERRTPDEGENNPAASRSVAAASTVARAPLLRPMIHGAREGGAQILDRSRGGRQTVESMFIAARRECHSRNEPRANDR